ncbi:MAG: hypothetical protein RLZZ301_1247 [Bacteroidota bacterium]|jgi:hypothetical protein
MKPFLLCIGFFVAFQSIGQVLSIRFVDSKSGEPVPNANCFLSHIGDTVFSRVSDANGRVLFDLTPFYKPGETLHITYLHAIYQKGNRSFLYPVGQDTVQAEILLKRERIQEIKEITVSAVSKPDTVFESKIYSVADFELLENDQLLLLTYDKQLQKGAQLQLFDTEKVCAAKELPEQANYLVRDYQGNVHVVCQAHVWGVRVDSASLELGEIPKDYFFKYIAPIIDTNALKVYFSNYNAYYPAFDYYIFNRSDSSYKTILQIKDDFMMELYRSEIKWVDVRTKLWAKNKAQEIGLDAEVIIGAKFFTQSLYYKEVYAPMFQRNDSIFIFDYPKDLLRIYNANGLLLTEVPIHHHYQAKETGFQRQLIQDRKTGGIYAVYQREGSCFLGLVNCQTGAVSAQYKLGFRYVDKIRVHNNQAYYIYRPFESTQKKFLYKERIPFNLPLIPSSYGTKILNDTGK